MVMPLKHTEKNTCIIFKFDFTGDFGKKFS